MKSAEEKGAGGGRSIQDAVRHLTHYDHHRIGKCLIGEIRRAERGEASVMDVRKLVAGGVMDWDGVGAPRLTPIGTGIIMAEGFGISFFDVCVLAVTYRFARAMSAQPGGGAAAGEPAGEQGAATIPMRTIQNYFIDWPCDEDEVRKSVSRLRAAGLLPRCKSRRVECSASSLANVHGQLTELDGWIERTAEDVRRMLIAPAPTATAS
ncbi:MAG: hypothetical protein OXI27_08735 [Thaumarchaeota archaeon]|nr:hypothetical protein [Nitrososphaerota archaeon]MDE0526660.1 hypothetical protein [Nitrososphaerota archaeon]